jgi:hypothetical protein
MPPDKEQPQIDSDQGVFDELARAKEQYDVYLELAKLAQLSVAPTETTWAHDPDISLSLQLYPQKE